MGEYADYILNGDDCQECGMYIGDGDGFPRSCPACRRAGADDCPPEQSKAGVQKRGRFGCQLNTCNRNFASEYAMLQHMRDKHGVGRDMLPVASQKDITP